MFLSQNCIKNTPLFIPKILRERYEINFTWREQTISKFWRIFQDTFLPGSNHVHPYHPYHQTALNNLKVITYSSIGNNFGLPMVRRHLLAQFQIK